MSERNVLKEDEALLREIIRSIDKKLDYTVRDGSDAQGPHFTVHLSRHGWEGTAVLPLKAVHAAKSDLVSRTRLRQKIKRLRDHMWDTPVVKDVLGIKAANMLKESLQGESAPKPYFMRRPPMGNKR
jgi:hypothetical protein